MTSKKDFLFSLLLSGFSLGTAWAIRGAFGHEQGAAWAGAIGALAIILISKRADWYNKFLKASLAAAVGWGIGGIMSYGRVVGFGHGSDFGNVYYGFLMLFLIGGLYGFIGGGLFGLALNDGNKQKIKWHLLMVEMTVGAVITYYFLIHSWEWFMTPPRSEAWAACLGMALSLTWFMLRNGQYAALRVAVFSGLGGGFGFAFGNFLQVIGNSAGIRFFNLWNVMEYSLGFFGGVGMAYGTFTSNWEIDENVSAKKDIILPLLSIALIIPFIVWDQTFTEEAIQSVAGINNAALVSWISILLILFSSIFWIKKYYFNNRNRLIGFSFRNVYVFFTGHFILYTLFHFLISGAFLNGVRPEQYLYLINLAVIFYFVPKVKPVFYERPLSIRWTWYLIGIVLFFALLAALAINSHGELPHMQKRFE